MNVGTAHEPEVLFGREQEIGALKKAFDEVRLGGTRFVLIEGEAGVGKSSLVGAVRDYIKANSGIYVAGKFDLSARNVPYNAIIHGLSNYLEAEVLPSAERMNDLQGRIAEALGVNAPLIARLIPMLSKVLDANDDRAIATVSERRDRLSTTLQACLEALGTPGNPVVLFLDDLHWADAASRQLILNLLTSGKPPGLLLIGTLRTNDMSDLNPVRRLLTDLAQARVRYRRMPLANLRQDDIKALLSKYLGTDQEFADELSLLIFDKTLGNPFFTHQFIGRLVREGALSSQGKDWRYHPRVAVDLNATENVLDLITQRVESLSPAARSVLCLGSCFGNRFKSTELVLVGGWSLDEVKSCLGEALEAGLIISAKGQFLFAHDRIHEAVYRMNDPEERALFHYKIATSVVRNLREAEAKQPHSFDAEIDKLAFFLARQFKDGAKFIRGAEEQLSVARINLAAARRSKESLLYDTANAHVDAALEILPEVNWTTYPELLHALYMIKAEATAFAGDVAAGNEIFQFLFRNVRAPEQLAEVYQQAMAVKVSFGDYEEGIRLGVRGLNALGVSIKEDPTWFDLFFTFLVVRRQMRHKSLAGLEHMPKGKARPTDRLAMAISANAFFHDSDMVTLMTLRSCSRTLTEGIFDGSWSSLGLYSALLATRHGRYREAAVLGEISMRACQTATLAEKAMTNFLVPAFLQVWTLPLRNIIEKLNANFEFAKESGFTASAMSSALIAGSYEIFAGTPIPQLDKRLVGYSSYILQHRSQALHDSLHCGWLAIKALQGKTLSPGSFSIGDATEADLVKRVRNYPSSNALAWYGLWRLWVDYILGDHQKAAESLAIAKRILVTLPFSYPTLVFETFKVLLQARLYGDAGIGKPRMRLSMKRSLRKMQRLSELSSGDIRAMFLLAQAEYDRVCGDFDRASNGFTEAIVNARQNDFLHLEALGEELFGLLKEQRQNRDEALTHFHRAYVLYSNWGATAKAERLKTSARLEMSPNFQDSGEIVYLSESDSD